MGKTISEHRRGSYKNYLAKKNTSYSNEDVPKSIRDNWASAVTKDNKIVVYKPTRKPSAVELKPEEKWRGFTIFTKTKEFSHINIYIIVHHYDGNNNLDEYKVKAVKQMMISLVKLLDYNIFVSMLTKMQKIIPKVQGMSDEVQHEINTIMEGKYITYKIFKKHD